MKFWTSGFEGAADTPPRSQEFSLVLGGPLFQLMRRAHLSDDTLMLVRQRIIVISLLAWLPLLALTALEGRLLAGSTPVPFLQDLEVHIRFLITTPLLVAAELVVHMRMRSLVKLFVERRLIPESSMTRFDTAIASAFRLRNSTLAEAMLIAFVYVVGILIVWRHYIVLDTTTWYATASAEGSRLSLAGIWYGYVSVPIFQFLLCRWYFRLFIWMRFLWQVSRIELSLIPTHPDHSAGLGFLSDTIHAFALLAVAHGAMLAGTLANRIFFMGASLTDYKSRLPSWWSSCCASSSARFWCLRRNLLEPSGRACASTARWRSVTFGNSMKSGGAAARMRMSHSWVAQTSSPWLISTMLTKR